MPKFLILPGTPMKMQYRMPGPWPLALWVLWLKTLFYGNGNNKHYNNSNSNSLSTLLLSLTIAGNFGAFKDGLHNLLFFYRVFLPP